jgi:hypothetical protein
MEYEVRLHLNLSEWLERYSGTEAQAFLRRLM